MNKAELCEALAATGDNLYDFAWLDETSGWLHRFQPCSNCHNGYSVAKLFIATAMGLLWDEGKLSLDDPVGRFFPTDSPWRQVSVHHLLTHTSGIDRGFLDIDNDDLSQYPSDDYLSILLAQPLPYAPGTHEQYSDAVFYLLARIVEQVQGQPADDFLTEWLFRPMGFGETAWSRCPQHHPIGGTGFYAGAQDVVKLGLLYLEFAPQPSPNQAIADNRSIEQRICIKPAKRSRQRDLSLLVRFMQRRATPITQKDVSRR